MNSKLTIVMIIVGIITAGIAGYGVLQNNTSTGN